MWTESEIQNFKKIFVRKMLNMDSSSKLPTKLAVYLILESEKLIDDFFEKNKDSS